MPAKPWIAANAQGSRTFTYWGVYDSHGHRLATVHECDNPRREMDLAKAMALTPELLEFCKAVSQLDDSGPDPAVYDVKHKAIELLSRLSLAGE